MIFSVLVVDFSVLVVIFWIYLAISSLQVDKAIFQDRVIRFPFYTQEVMCVGNVAVVNMKKLPPVLIAKLLNSNDRTITTYIWRL